MICKIKYIYIYTCIISPIYIYIYTPDNDIPQSKP